MEHIKSPSMSIKRQHDRFCCQILQLYPKIDFPNEEYLRNIVNQRNLYDNVFAETALKYKLPARYQFRVLKELLARIENSIQDWDNDEISDDLTKSFSTLFISQALSESSPVEQKFYVTYTLSSLLSDHLPQDTSQQFLIESENTNYSRSLPTVVLSESQNIISAGGTTGFRTWEAALHLGDYLCANPELVKDKCIIELGSGTAYLSIICALHLQASHVLATDGSPSVISHHALNFKLNNLSSPSQIRSEQLVWGQSLSSLVLFPELHCGNKIDLVLGADVTYDESGITKLLVSLADLFTLFPDAYTIISATVRKETTFNTFLSSCERKGWKIDEINWVVKSQYEQNGPFFEAKTPIKILSINKKI